MCVCDMCDGVICVCRDGLGKEIITRYTTSLKSNSVWYTDANGREMQRRVRNHRPTWKWNNTAPVTGNYYPVNSRIYIRVCVCVSS